MLAVVLTRHYIVEDFITCSSYSNVVSGGELGDNTKLALVQLNNTNVFYQ